MSTVSHLHIYICASPEPRFHNSFFFRSNVCVVVLCSHTHIFGQKQAFSCVFDNTN